jgi:hypothetical protein
MITVNPELAKHKHHLRKALWIGLLLASPIIYYFYKYNLQNKYGVYDQCTHRNSKVFTLAQTALNKVIAHWSDTNTYVGISPQAYIQVSRYLASIASIEGYKAYGTESWRKYNRSYIKITYVDGHVENEQIAFGSKVGGAPTPAQIFLAKVLLNNGKITDVLTNGTEDNIYPDQVSGNLYSYFERAILLDAGKVRDAYYHKTYQPTKKEEWEKIK